MENKTIRWNTSTITKEKHTHRYIEIKRQKNTDKSGRNKSKDINERREPQNVQGKGQTIQTKQEFPIKQEKNLHRWWYIKTTILE